MSKKINEYINEYIFDNELIKESMKVLWKKQVKIFCVAFLFIMSYGSITYFYQKEAVFLYYVILIGIFFILSYFRYCEAVKKSVENCMDVNKNVIYKKIIKINNEISVEFKSNIETIQFNQIKNLVNGKDLILIINENRKITVLKKNGFIYGEAESCYKYLKAMSKNRNML